MSLYLDHAPSVNLVFPGVEIHSIDGGLEPQAFSEFVESLTIPAHASWTGEEVTTRPALLFERTLVKASRTTEMPRDAWAPDHHWHFDGGYSGKMNQFASVLYAQRLQGNVASTGFIDTSELLHTIEADHPGITEEIATCLGEFSVTRYFTDLLSVQGEAAYASIQRTLQSKSAVNLEEVARIENERYPSKHFPAVLTHPFRNEACAMIDDLNLIRLLGISAARGEEIITIVRDQYLNLPREELAVRPYHYLHQWDEGQVVIFPQVGTLHRADPSPPGEIRRDTLRLFII